MEVVNGEDAGKRGHILISNEGRNEVIVRGCGYSIVDEYIDPTSTDGIKRKKQFIESSISAYDVRLIDPKNE